MNMPQNEGERLPVPQATIWRESMAPIYCYIIDRIGEKNHSDTMCQLCNNNSITRESTNPTEKALPLTSPRTALKQLTNRLVVVLGDAPRRRQLVDSVRRQQGNVSTSTSRSSMDAHLMNMGGSSASLMNDSISCGSLMGIE